jgi:hypothetical protein
MFDDWRSYMAAPTLFQKARISNPTNTLVLLTQRESGKPDLWCACFISITFGLTVLK